jgi:hypothetical protein
MQTCGSYGEQSSSSDQSGAASSTPSRRAVSIAPGAAQNPPTPQIAAFLDQYFAAINEHDYQAYVALRSPQLPGITVSQFDSGYCSTADSDETLLGVSSAANGDSVAHVTFNCMPAMTEE